MQNSPIALMRKLAPLYQDCFPVRIVEISMVNMRMLYLSLVSVFICLIVSGLIRCAHARALFIYLFIIYFYHFLHRPAPDINQVNPPMWVSAIITAFKMFLKKCAIWLGQRVAKTKNLLFYVSKRVHVLVHF